MRFIADPPLSLNHQAFDKGSGALRWVHTLISNVNSFLLETYYYLYAF